MTELLTVQTARSRRPSMTGERRVTALAIGLAAIFVTLTVLALVFPHPVLGPWLPAHLLLAGAATTAIGGVMPFFSAAVTGGRPAPAPLRAVGVVGVATGAVLSVIGRLATPALAGPDAWPAGLGGLVFIGGVISVTAATLIPLRSATGPARFILGTVYAVAMANVLIGTTLATLMLLGSADIARTWQFVKGAHAWLNLFGFVSLVVAGSLVHLLPTVVGARISRTRASIATYACLSVGPIVAAAGFAFDARVVALVGAGLVAVGAVALGVHALNVLGKRAAWTTDLPWHRFTSWSLVAGICWFLLGGFTAAVTVYKAPTMAAGWDIGPLIAPLGLGWVGQVLFGAWSHLVPAVGAGSPQRHAHQRRLLGTAATTRFVVYNAGVALMAVAPFTDRAMSGTIFLAGTLAVAGATAFGVGLLVFAFVASEPAATL